MSIGVPAAGCGTITAVDSDELGDNLDEDLMDALGGRPVEDEPGTGISLGSLTPLRWVGLAVLVLGAVLLFVSAWWLGLIIALLGLGVFGYESQRQRLKVAAQSPADPS